MKENLRKVDTMETEPTYGLMEKNMLEGGKTAIKMDKELIYGLMEKNMLENIKMMNFMGKEDFYFQKTQVMRTN